MEEYRYIKSLREGNEEVFEFLFRKYFLKLCLYAHHYVRDNKVAEEIVEEFFVYLWDNHENIHIESNLSGYFFKSVHNRCLKYLRHEKIKRNFSKEGSYVFTERELLEPISEQIPEAYLAAKELEHTIIDALNTLPDQCRKVFELSRYEDLSYQEIADKMNISINTVKTHMKRALSTLKDALKDFLKIILIISSSLIV